MKKRTASSYAVTQRLMQMDFPADFADLVGQELNTDFTAEWMLRYLDAAQPDSMELVADEMLEILAFRDRCIQKHQLYQ